MLFPRPFSDLGECKTGPQPTSLLDACLHWTGSQGGTIHQFLPHLFWSEPKRQGPDNPIPYYSLWLGARENLRRSICLGFIQSKKQDLPKIAPDMPGVWFYHKTFPL
jgi:hypothetical protein